MSGLDLLLATWYIQKLRVMSTCKKGTTCSMFVCSLNYIHPSEHDILYSSGSHSFATSVYRNSEYFQHTLLYASEQVINNDPSRLSPDRPRPMRPASFFASQLNIFHQALKGRAITAPSVLWGRTAVWRTTTPLQVGYVWRARRALPRCSEAAG